jgi:cation transporter-like permease
VPDPLPGLATGDSTFFFLWPLLILAAGVAGSILGGRVATRSERRP